MIQDDCPADIRIETLNNLRGQIIATAEKQYAASHGHRISLREIARELRVTHPAVYTYFNSKEDLICALKLNLLHQLKQELFIGINPHGTFRQIMNQLAENFLKFFQEDKTRFSLFIEPSSNKECGETQLQILEYIDQLLMLPEININLPQLMWYALIGNVFAWYSGEVTKERVATLITETIERLSRSQ